MFSCIPSRGNFNKSPNIVQFRFSMRELPLRNSITAVNKSNVIKLLVNDTKVIVL